MKIYIKDKAKFSSGRFSSNKNCLHRCRFGRKVSHIDLTRCVGQGLTLYIMLPYLESKGSDVSIQKNLNAKKRLTGRKRISIGTQTDAIQRRYKRKNVNSKSSLKKAKDGKIARIRNVRNKVKKVKTPKRCGNCKRKNADNSENKKAVISESNLLQYITTLYKSGAVATSHQEFIERVKKTVSTDSIDDTPTSSTSGTSSLVSNETFKIPKIESENLSLIHDDRKKKVGRKSNRKDLKESNYRKAIIFQGQPYRTVHESNASSVKITRRKRSTDQCESFVSQPIRKKMKPCASLGKEKTIDSSSIFFSERVTLNRKRDERRKLAKRGLVKLVKVKSEKFDNVENDKDAEQRKKDLIEEEMMAMISYIDKDKNLPNEPF